MNAARAARAWRDKQLLAAEALTLLEFCQLPRSNNVSGVPGVHFMTSPRQPEGFWQAKLKLNGKYKSKSFSVQHYGGQLAYQKAVAARAEMLALAKDRPYLYDAVAKRMAQNSGRPEPKNVI